MLYLVYQGQFFIARMIARHSSVMTLFWIVHWKPYSQTNKVVEKYREKIRWSKIIKRVWHKRGYKRSPWPAASNIPNTSSVSQLVHATMHVKKLECSKAIRCKRLFDAAQRASQGIPTCWLDLVQDPLYFFYSFLSPFLPPSQILPFLHSPCLPLHILVSSIRSYT